MRGYSQIKVLQRKEKSCSGLIISLIFYGNFEGLLGSTLDFFVCFLHAVFLIQSCWPTGSHQYPEGGSGDPSDSNILKDSKL